MPLSIAHLRRWFAGGAIAVVLIVAGVYFYARHRVQNALKQVPEKIGVEIKQSATGFSISKSEQGRTLFKIEASKAVQFKQGGRAELHDVAITLYGRDSSRYDHIYGSDFEYDPQSGNVTAQGERNTTSSMTTRSMACGARCRKQRSVGLRRLGLVRRRRRHS